MYLYNIIYLYPEIVEGGWGGGSWRDSHNHVGTRRTG